MLKLAYPYKEKLDCIWQSIIFEDKYKYYNDSNYWKYTITLAEDSYYNMQMVSVDKDDNIIGYLSSSIDRQCNKISAMGAINFYDMNPTFSKDFYTYLTELFTKFNFNKIEWRVVIGNPAEKMYDRIIKKYNGNIVGVQHQSTVLYDGTICDEKFYELFRKDYLNRRTILCKLN
jgi:hypothetical protein